MPEDSRKPPRPALPRSIPPDVPFGLDSDWDDDTVPGLEIDESAFDRVTAIPDLPPEVYAKQVMADAEAAAPSSTAGDSTEPLPRISSEPPVVSVRPLEPLDLAPPPTIRGAVPSEGRDSTEPVLELELDLGDVVRSGPPPALLVPSEPESPRVARITEMKDRYATGDFSGALVVAEGLLELSPDDLDAQRYAQSCRDVLTQMYSARLGALTQRVRVAVPGEEIRWLSMDHRAGFMLSLIDGSSTVEELLDISGMNRLDALRILYTLFDQRVIALG